MNFRVDRWRAQWLRRSVLALTTVGTLLLSSCGGSGTEGQSRQFNPTRIIVFGDETSLLLPPSSPTAVDALKYGINGFDPTTATPNTVRDCRANSLWVQVLADDFGLVFGQCNPTGLPVTGQMRATVGAKVADVVTSIDQFLGAEGDRFIPDDLVTVLVGTYDILELYESVRTSAITEAAAVAEAERRGELLAAQFDRITDNPGNSRGRALYVTVPDLGETPFGIGDVTGRTERVRVLKLLSQSFNDRLRATIAVNGRSIGSLNVFQFFRNIVRFIVEDDRTPSGFVNATGSACTTPDVLQCTSLTLQSAAGGEVAATDTNWLWASGYYLSAGAQLFLGQEAIDLARGLPF